MPPEIVSTARPTGLRLLGFLALIVGAVLVGVGATMTWATVGFPNDNAHALDVPTKGIDVWEGVVALAVAAIALIALVAMRVVASGRARSLLAWAIAAGGLVVTALAGYDLATARDRFGGVSGLTQIARRIAIQQGQPVDRIRALLEANFGHALRVDAGAGLWMTLAGGLVLIAAGALSLAWVRTRAAGVADEPADAADAPEPADPA
jgi:Tryptophan-associated transmembrane protein (Trp_oprn_chp)